MGEVFRKHARQAAAAVGSPWAFIAAALTVVIWAATGPMFHYSDAWQLVINTGTTIVTFLMVFLIQNSQNRDGRAVQLKLDELLRGVEGARTGLVSLEGCTDKELGELEEQFRRIRERQAQALAEGALDALAGPEQQTSQQPPPAGAQRGTAI